MSSLTLTSDFPLDSVTPEQLRTLCGDFWVEIAPNLTFLDAISTGQLELAKNSSKLLYDIANLRSLQTTPLYYQPDWSPIRLALSDMTTSGGKYVFTRPTNLVNATHLADSIEESAVTLLPTTDFTVDTTQDTIEFAASPFDNSYFTQTSQSTETYVWLWAYEPQYDLEYLYNHYGYVLGIYQETSEQYKTLLEVVWDALVAGTSRLHVLKLLSLAYDVPFVKETQETVQSIDTVSGCYQITTDQHTYLLGTDDLPSVIVGESVEEGTPLVDGFELFDLADGETPDSVTSLTIGSNMLDPSENYDEFVLSDTPVTPTINGDEISWSLGGSNTDEQTFWDSVRTRETALGTTLYDAIVSAEGSIPSTINPLTFTVKYLLRNNALVLLRPSYMTGATRFSDVINGLIRRLLPPWSMLLYANEDPASSPSPSPG